MSGAAALLRAADIRGGSELAGTDASSAVLTVCWSAAGETDAAGVDDAPVLAAALELVLELPEAEPLLLLLDPHAATARVPARAEQVTAVARVRRRRRPCVCLSADM